MKTNSDSKESIDLNELTDKLRSEDKNYADLSKRIQIIYWVLIPVYLIMTIRHIMDGSELSNIIGSLCFLFAMLIFALGFRGYYKEYNQVDYSQPTLVMLKKAAYRYKPFQLKTLWFLLAVILIDAGLSMNTSLGADFIWVQLSFLGAMGIALFVGLYRWKIRYKPLRDSAIALIKEIEG